MSSKIERAFEKRIKFPIKNRAKKDNNWATKRTINKLKIAYMKKKHIFYKNGLLHSINNLSVILEIIVR